MANGHGSRWLYLACRKGNAMPVPSTILLTDEIRAALHQPDEQQNEALEAALEGARPADIAEAMNDFSHRESLAIFERLDDERAAVTLSEIETERTRFLLDNISPERISALLERLPEDDAADVLSEAAPDRVATLLADFNAHAPAEAADVMALLAYAPDTAGRLMTDGFVQLAPSLTVDEAFARVRQADPEVETLSNLYVTDAADPSRLVGVVSLRELVRANPSQRLSEIMTHEPITVSVDSDQEEVARLIAKYGFQAMPVLDRNGALAGIVTVDDVLDVLVEENTEDQLRFGAVESEGGSRPYFSASIWRVVRSRVGWLILLFVAETSTGAVLRHFEDELAKVVALSFFIPLLIGTGGNTGAQTVSTIIRGLALGEIKTNDTTRVVLRELLSGLLLGTLLGAIGFARAMLWHSGIELSAVVGLTILAIVAWANSVGALIPLIAQRFKIDPALVSAPLITTFVDATGLAIYLLIAKALLTALH
jgi:magnesium transporter